MDPVKILQLKYQITPSQAVVMTMLAKEKLVTTEMLVEAGITDHIRVLMSRLRDRLEGSKIEIMSQRSIGYWMRKEDRVRVLQDMLDKNMELPGGSPGNVPTMGAT